MREGKLRVSLNTRKRDNFGFYDPLTCTNLSISRPISDDLNRILIDSNTLKEVQLDISNIKKAIKYNNLTIVEGSLDGIEPQFIAPVPSTFNPSAQDMQKWQTLVQGKVMSNLKK